MEKRDPRPGEVLERRQVIQDEDPATMRTDHEVILALLDCEVVHRNGGNAGAKPRPVCTAVGRDAAIGRLVGA